MSRKISIPLKEYYKIYDELLEIKRASVPYCEDQLKMANRLISHMQSSIEHVLKQLSKHE